MPAPSQDNPTAMNPQVPPTNAGSQSEGSAQSGARKFLAVADRLAAARLGIHASLYQALKAKNPPSAAHCMRVALICSEWAASQQMEEDERSHLEVAGLLHDIGKIGVPDELLQKPGSLSEHERLLVNAQRTLADQLMQTAGAQESLIQTVGAARVDHNTATSQGVANRLSGMLRIADAYDSMTSSQVFRRAISRELALEELCRFAGTQFDPVLVREFAILVSQPREGVEQEIANRWLGKVTEDVAHGFQLASLNSSVKPSSADHSAETSSLNTRYHQKLLDSLDDAVIYLDHSRLIISWNLGAEHMLGREASSVLHKQWSSELIGLMAEDDADVTCPIAQMSATNALARGRYRLRNLNGKELTVNLRAVPLFDDAQSRIGAMLIIRDSSKQANLEQKVETLHAIATRDPLTKVANREELSRRLPEFVDGHLTENCPGSVIMCDIDYFKKINDNYGHQAGDDALVTFAGILSEIARDDDLVVRYGGEEFVIICEGCDNATATKRAEQIRLAVQQTPVPSLDGSTMTSSFGVTEIQPGDTHETLLARVDRALMNAKETGRNRVVQLGSGQSVAPSDPANPESQSRPTTKSNSWLGWFSANKQEPLVSAEYLASVPREVAVQKLEGFINDHRAELVSTEDESVVVRVDPNPATLRRGERASAMLLQVKITVVQIRCGTGTRSEYQNRTKFDASVIAYRARDRRSDSLLGQASQLLQSFQSYLVAQPVDDELRSKIIEPR